MQTDSEQLLHAGLGVGQRTFDQLLEHAGSRDNFDATVCHQVGGTHRKLMLESLSMPADTDFTTFRWLGNTGSVALPLALALGLQSSGLAPQSRVALLGIGSGINSVMMSTVWPSPIVAGELDPNAIQNLRQLDSNRHGFSLNPRCELHSLRRKRRRLCVPNAKPSSHLHEARSPKKKTPIAPY